MRVVYIQTLLAIRLSETPYCLYFHLSRFKNNNEQEGKHRDGFSIVMRGWQNGEIDEEMEKEEII